MTLTDGTYTITADALLTVAKLTAGTANLPVTLDFPAGADNEKWVVKTSEDGTFTIKNKAYSSNDFATADSWAGADVVAGAGISWTQSGNAIVSSGFAWQAKNGSIVLQPKNPNNANQSFTFTPSA